MHVKYLYRRPWGPEKSGLFMADPADGVGEGGGGGEGDPKPGDKGQQDLPGIKSEGDGLKDLVSKQKEVIDQLQADLKKREDAEKKAQDKKRVEEEGAQKLLEERSAELEAAKEQLAEFEKMQKAMAERLFAKLTQEAQDKLKPFEGRLKLPEWIDLLEAEAKTHTAEPGKEGTSDIRLPPPTGSGRPRKSDGQDSYTPTERGLQLMEQYGVSDEMLRKMHYGKSFASKDEQEDSDLDASRKVFSQSVQKFKKDLIKKAEPELLVVKTSGKVV